MSSTTKRWMQDELRQLLEQRERYELAQATARDVAQVMRRTVRLRAIDEEILGHREALAALEPMPATPVASAPRRRRQTTVAPTIGASLALMPRRQPFAGSLAKVVGSAFAVGFAVTAMLLVTIRPAPPHDRASVSRTHTPDTAAPPRATQTTGERRARPATLDPSVHAASAPDRARRRSR